MAKIVQVLNSIISNENKISNVLRNIEEYFFLYNKKHKWSIGKPQNFATNGGYYVCFYPQEGYSLEDIVKYADDLDDSSYVVYRTEDIRTQEAYETFRELYQIVSSKLYGLDEIFDEIINDN